MRSCFVDYLKLICAIVACVATGIFTHLSHASVRAAFGVQPFLVVAAIKLLHWPRCMAAEREMKLQK